MQAERKNRSSPCEMIPCEGRREDMIQRRDVELLGKRPDVRVTPPNFVFPQFFFSVSVPSERWRRWWYRGCSLTTDYIIQRGPGAKDET